MIDWEKLKTTVADGRNHMTGRDTEYRHNPASGMKVESIEVRDGDDAIKIHKTGFAAWTNPYRVKWL